MKKIKTTEKPRTTTPAQVRATAKYDKTHIKGYYIKLNLINDNDIIKRFAEVESVQGYIKELVRKDINKNNL